MIIGEIYGAKVLKVTEIFFYDLHDVLRVQFGFYGFVRQFNSA